MAEASPNPTVFVTFIDDSILGRKHTQLNFWGRKDQNLMLQIGENLESIRHHRDQDPGIAQPAPVQLLNQPPPPLVQLNQPMFFTSPRCRTNPKFWKKNLKKL
jgi:hypothetical protein